LVTPDAELHRRESKERDTAPPTALPRIEWAETGRTRTGERTISSGEKPKLEKHPGMLRMRNTCPGTAVAFKLAGGGSIMASGRSDELKGRVKEAAGALTGDKKLKREGKADQVVGKIKQKVEKVIDKVKDALT
jgi:uncharacterized protein YjbJ (UPF0337 family)